MIEGKEAESPMLAKSPKSRQKSVTPIVFTPKSPHLSQFDTAGDVQEQDTRQARDLLAIEDLR